MDWCLFDSNYTMSFKTEPERNPDLAPLYFNRSQRVKIHHKTFNKVFLNDISFNMPRENFSLTRPLMHILKIDRLLFVLYSRQGITTEHRNQREIYV